MRRTTILLLSLLLAAAAVPLHANEAQKADSEGKRVNVFLQAAKRQPPTDKVFTNEDLVRRTGGVVAPETPDDPGRPASELAAEADSKTDAGAVDAMRAAQAQRVAAGRRADQAERELAAAEARVEAWKKTLLAIKNPLLPRPQPPEDPEQRARWDAMDNVQRRGYAEEQLRAAEAFAEAKRAELADWRSR